MELLHDQVRSCPLRVQSGMLCLACSLDCLVGSPLQLTYSTLLPFSTLIYHRVPHTSSFPSLLTPSLSLLASLLSSPFSPSPSPLPPLSFFPSYHSQPPEPPPPRLQQDTNLKVEEVLYHFCQICVAAILDNKQLVCIHPE